ncbi:MAG: PilZ domain-containing protein [Thermodesulfobacteriota bacterium]|nr:PilZ domain-containing protein [Thermodesulfobacteriota bacterium]
MREVTLFPGCVMEIPCPECESKGKVKFDRPPVKGFIVKCVKCSLRFKVRLNVRKYYRKKTSIPVSFSFRDIDTINKPGSYSGEVIDISQGGLCIETSTIYYIDFQDKIDEVLYFIFILPDKYETVRGKGIIRRTQYIQGERNFKLGIMFKDMDFATSKKVGFFLWN